MEFEIHSNEVIYELDKLLQQDITKKVDEGFKTPAMGTRSQVKLPPLIVKTFDGNVLQWKSFYYSFKAAVHESNLSEIENFNQFKRLLKRKCPKGC